MSVDSIPKRTISLHLIISFTFLIFTQEGFASQTLLEQTEPKVRKTLPNFRFVAAGDFGCSGEANRTVANIITMSPRLVLGLGDFAYRSEAECWFNLISPLESNSIDIRIVLGSHDISKNLVRHGQYLDHFNMDKPYYSFDYQNVHFIGMTTGQENVIPYNNGSEQYRFVKNDLENIHNNTDIDWIIIFGFDPLYTSSTFHPADNDLRDLYHPLFSEHGVDLVLQAHNHNYQRTYPLIYNEQSPSKPIISDKNQQTYYDPEGEIYLTAGTAGAELHEFEGQRPFIVRQLENHGFVNIDITDNGEKLISTFYENTDLVNEDQFVITKDFMTE
jgi:hypothetical protein